MSIKAEANEPLSDLPLEDWPPDAKEVTEENVQQWFDQLRFGVSETTSDVEQDIALQSAAVAINNVMQHFR